MRQEGRRQPAPWVGSVVLVVLAAGAVVGVVAVAPHYWAPAVRVYLLLAAALALRLLVLALVRAHPRARDEVFRRSPRSRPAIPPTPNELGRIKASLTISTVSAMELHYRVRRLLREIASDRLEVRRGISMEGEPERAREALGEAAWSLLRPDLPPPADRLGPGLPLDRLSEIVGALEAL